MSFQVGDTVVHWSYGLGQIIGLEERAVGGENRLYYEVRIQNMDIWVPADEKLGSRVRPPTTARAFKKLFDILRGPAGALSDDRRERKLQLHTKLAGGDAKALCQVIRDLTTLEARKPLSDDDKAVLKRVRMTLLREWEFSLQLPLAQVEADLYRLLGEGAAPVAA